MHAYPGLRSGDSRRCSSGRDPSEAPHLTQRICGVCSVPHGVAAALALEKAGQGTIPENARVLRNLVMGANFIQSHILHFYHLSLLDYVGRTGHAAVGAAVECGPADRGRGFDATDGSLQGRAQGGPSDQ